MQQDTADDQAGDRGQRSEWMAEAGMEVVVDPEGVIEIMALGGLVLQNAAGEVMDIGCSVTDMLGDLLAGLLP